ncbi:MAG: hypothetical protein ACI80M_001570 [Gammaproteobacteria bacterium]
MSDLTNTGVFVVEGLSRDKTIPVHRNAVTAFLGPAPRGPVNHPVQVTGYDQYRRMFGAPGCHSRLEHLIRQFFANGGESVWIVRVVGSSRRNFIEIPCTEDALVLRAANPGPLEHIRASVDYDGITALEPGCFNLVLQRVRSVTEPLVEEQETYNRISIDQGDPRYIGHVLAQSRLVMPPTKIPTTAPLPTIRGDAVKVVSYIDCQVDWPAEAAPDDYDLVGSASATTGLFALNSLPDLDVLCILSGKEDRDIGPVAQLAADRYCTTRQAMLVVDPPVAWKSVMDAVEGQGQLRLTSLNIMTYFPLLRTRSDAGETIIVSAMGAVAGALVASREKRNLVARDYRNAVTIRGRYRPSVDLTNEQSALLARFGVNSLMPASRLQMKFCGDVTMARTGGLTGEWKALTHRREGLFVVGSIRKSTTWAGRESSTPELWSEISEQVRDFLSKLRSEGRLAGEFDEQAFYIKCDADTNARAVGQTGDVTLLAGIAFEQANKFSAFKFHRAGDSCEIIELGVQSDSFQRN